jgi:peptide/nickel transport system permease protein
LSFTGWAAMSRVIRGMVFALREEQFILAVKSQGATFCRILIRHLMPATAGFVIVRATILIPAYILSEVTLSFLGIGIQEPTPSWGNMLSVAQDIRVLTEFPWTLAPGVVLFFAILAFHFLGEVFRRKFALRQDS